MMLFDRTRIYESIEKSVATGSTITAEGQPVVMTSTGGVKPAAATATDKFYGVAWAQQLTIVSLPFAETVVAPVGGGAVNLSRTNLYTATAKVGSLTVSYAGPAAPGTVYVNITQGIATFDAADAGTYRLSYRYEPTTVEVLTVQGNIPAGGSAQFITDTVGIIRRGEVYTTEYNTLIDWASMAAGVYALAVKNSLFTAYTGASKIAAVAAAVADNAVVVDDGVIVNVPATGFGTSGTGSNAFLGVAY